jgi:hypothetical protein
MQTSDQLRHQIIKSLMAQHTEKIADAAILLWEQMATQIIAIVGESGFNSLYARSVFITHASYPWLAAEPGSQDKNFSSSPHTAHRFAALKMSLAGQTLAQASEANSLLLLNFTDILASLIGEQLTITILRSAWGSEEILAGNPNDATDNSDDEKRLSGHPKELKK